MVVNIKKSLSEDEKQKLLEYREKREREKTRIEREKTLH